MSAFGAEGAAVDRLALVRVLARTCSGLRDEGLFRRHMAVLGGLVGEVSDSFNTNSHFCLSVLAFMDALLIAHCRRALAAEPRRRVDLHR